MTFLAKLLLLIVAIGLAGGAFCFLLAWWEVECGNAGEREYPPALRRRSLPAGPFFVWLLAATFLVLEPPLFAPRISLSPPLVVHPPLPRFFHRQSPPPAAPCPLPPPRPPRAPFSSKS